MNNRNVLKIVASALLMVSLPAGAQVLGGNLGGAANGTLGGNFGRTGIEGAGRATGNAGIHASDATGTVRDRAERVGGRTRDVGVGAAGTARSRVDSTRGAADSTAHTAHSVGVGAGQRTGDTAAQTRNSAVQSAAAQTNAQPSAQPSGGLLVKGSGAAATEQRAMGRSVAAESAADWEASGDRSSVAGNAASQTDVSVRKDAQAE